MKSHGSCLDYSIFFDLCQNINDSLTLRGYERGDRLILRQCELLYLTDYPS